MSNWFSLSSNKDSHRSRSRSEFAYDRRQSGESERKSGFTERRTKVSGDEGENWLVTYGDMMSLLLTFFILLFSMSEINQEKFEEVAAAINKQVVKKEQKLPFQEMKQQLDSLIFERKLEKDVQVELDPLGIRIQLASSSLYESGSAEIKDDIKPVLGEVVQSIKGLTFKNYLVEVEGHTDDNPIGRNSRYDSNWELSAHRATNVVRLFVALGLDASKMKASGFGESRPVKPNRDASGKAIPENQAANRRVVVYIRRNV
jgi:chemotaxis protein MotB